MGVVNGRPFIHHVTLGLHPRIVRFREKLNYSSRGGKIVAGMQAWWAVLRKPPRLDATLTVDGQRAERRATAILVSNNPLAKATCPMRTTSGAASSALRDGIGTLARSDRARRTHEPGRVLAKPAAGGVAGGNRSRLGSGATACALPWMARS
jgi:hypothetical protein